MLAQHTATPLGSQWDQWYESPGQRRRQSVRTGRLVGRGLYTRSRMALGDGLEHGQDPAWDAREAEDLFNLLEQKVIPDFYNRNSDNILSPG